MSDLQLARKPEPQRAADVGFLTEILAMLLLLTIFTGGILFALL